MSEPATASSQAWVSWWEDRGALWGEGPAGGRVVLRVGSPDEELAAATDGWAFAALPDREALDVLGPDRRRFLNGFITCDVAPLEPGMGAYGFLTDGHGKILADAAVGALDDRFRLLLPIGRVEETRSRLARYVLADRVEFEAPDLATLWVTGRRAADGVSAAALPWPAEPWSVTPWSEGHAQAIGDFGGPAAVFETEPGTVPGIADRLVAAGCRPVGREALERARVIAGRPRFGVDFDTDALPQETGLSEAVSYTKGCYLGQEVVARIHYRGRVQRCVCRVAMSELEPPARGAVLRLDGEEVGRLGSAVAGIDEGPAVGLAMLHRKATEPGTTLTVEGGGEARVVGPVESPPTQEG